MISLVGGAMKSELSSNARNGPSLFLVLLLVSTGSDAVRNGRHPPGLGFGESSRAGRPPRVRLAVLVSGNKADRYRVFGLRVSQIWSGAPRAPRPIPFRRIPPVASRRYQFDASCSGRRLSSHRSSCSPFGPAAPNHPANGVTARGVRRVSLRERSGSCRIHRETTLKPAGGPLRPTGGRPNSELLVQSVASYASFAIQNRETRS